MRIRATLIAAIVIAACAMTPRAEASLVASESFWVHPTAYTDSSSLNGQNPVNGNTGFSAANAWSTNTSTIKTTTSIPGSGAGLTHPSLAAAPLDGALDFRVSHNRSAYRLLNPVPALSPTYYLSGLVRANSVNAFAVDGDYFAMGFGNSGIATGLHVGIRRDDALNGRRLTAYAGNQFLDLGAAVDDTTYMIILALTANTGGADSLTAWVHDGSTLSQALTGQSVETFANTTNLSRIMVQQREGNGNQITRAWGDELRLGTTLEDVYLIPEPASVALLGLGGLLITRRRGYPTP